MKAEREKLLEEASNILVQFLMKGDLGPYIEDLDPSLSVNGLEKLLKIHFLLPGPGGGPKVADFVERLPARIRRIKTSTESEPSVFNGEVRGRIDWGGTMSERRKRASRDTSVFICREPEKDYQISENIVLKDLLLAVQGILRNEAAQPLREGYGWAERWSGLGGLADELNELLAKNVYLKRIDVRPGQATEAMIERSLKSRNPLYREAGALLRRYRRLASMNFDEAEAKEVLRSTFIAPDKIPVLFELYWAAWIVRQMEGVRFHLIEKGGNLVAEWSSGGRIYKLYHDSAGSLSIEGPSLDHAKHLEEGDHYFARLIAALKAYEDLSGSTGEGAGRPDLVIEQYGPAGGLELAIIGEVKYTCDREYAKTGLKELLEYMALALGPGGGRLEPLKELYTDEGKVRGVLFTDAVPGPPISGPAVQMIRYGEACRVRWLPKPRFDGPLMRPEHTAP